MKKVKFGYESVNVGNANHLRFKGVVYIGRANKDEVKELIKKSKIVMADENPYKEVYSKG